MIKFVTPSDFGLSGFVLEETFFGYLIVLTAVNLPSINFPQLITAQNSGVVLQIQVGTTPQGNTA